jgi:hypothetical protein
LIKGFLSAVAGVFGPDVPLWAVELTTSSVVAIQASPDRQAIVSRAVAPLGAGVLIGDLREPNVIDTTAVRDAVQTALDGAGFSGSELSLVIPDEAVRIALLNVDSLPDADADRRAIIRWKLKKNVPFDVDSAYVAYQILGENGSVDLLVALSRQVIAAEYQERIESLGLHAGIVSSSTMASLNLLPDAKGDVLFVKKSPTSVTTSIVMGGTLRLYRKVTLGPLDDVVYPTLMYYQDTLGGSGLAEVLICGEGITESEAKEMAVRTGVRIQRLHSAELGDPYKPALGVLQLSS